MVLIKGFILFLSLWRRLKTHTDLSSYGCEVTPHWIVGSWWWGPERARVSATVGSVSPLGRPGSHWPGSHWPGSHWPGPHWPTHVSGHGTSHGNSHWPAWHSLWGHPLSWHAWHWSPILRLRRQRQSTVLYFTHTRIIIIF